MDRYGKIVFIDTEVDAVAKKVLDYGAISTNGLELHSESSEKFRNSIASYRYLCGHNVLCHDLNYIGNIVAGNPIEGIIDTLYLSPLLFPDDPHHALLKDDKLQADELNNPLNDAKKCMELFFKELNMFWSLERDFQEILWKLLHTKREFRGFFSFLKACDRGNGMASAFEDSETKSGDSEKLIKKFFEGKICSNVVLEDIVEHHPIELAYCLSLIHSYEEYSIIPYWVHKGYPEIESIMRKLRGTPCKEGCIFCKKTLDIHVGLKTFFGHDSFRLYEGEALQEKAVRAAMNGESLITLFPTGGGKSLTFQLPALIQGAMTKSLTVIISPLQSLMKDQVDNLEKTGIVDAVTINGMLSPIERAEAIKRVENGRANLLYISPEQLRSKTIERILMARNISRFVIDEAHCFSAWGQDFRVEYLYIGEFIRELSKKKMNQVIPVSCFTATAKQKVIRDIKDYFLNELGQELSIYATSASRKNLRYEVLHRESEEDKYGTLRSLIEEKKCPTIVYVSRTKKTFELAERLCRDGILARSYNGKMERNEKIKNQEEFIEDKIQVMVATSAFGMGVDKSNIRLVIHYDISDSLENYLQEAGRGGRDPKIQAECYILFSDNDLDKHFILLNQTKLSISEIQQVWKAIKDLTRNSPVLRRSPLEIARQAGWDDNVYDAETRVKTAISSLEKAGYVKRGKNVPRVYATSIRVKSLIEARSCIEANAAFDTEEQKEKAVRIMSLLISKRSVAGVLEDEAESRTDYIADQLGISREDTLRTISLLREAGIIEDERDLKAYIQTNDKKNRTLSILQEEIQLEKLLLHSIGNNASQVIEFDLKQLNETARRSGIKGSTVNKLKTIMYYWLIKGYIQKRITFDLVGYCFAPGIKNENINKDIKHRRVLCTEIAEYLFERNAGVVNKQEKDQTMISFSELELKRYLESKKITATVEQIEDALLYMSKIGAMKLEEGFLVLYSSIEVKRLELNNHIKYKVEDYKQLSEYYKQKIQQIHIVGAFANMMAKNYNQALEFVNDYFQMDYKKFLQKYFDGEQMKDMNRNITPEKYKKLFGGLSQKQLEIINDDQSQYIVCVAGPGSGKTRVLVHKLASLLLLEDVKHEELLMLTFSRAAVTEFKMRLYELIGNAAAFVEIKTFHSYCFDLIGETGKIENAENVVRQAVMMLRMGEVEQSKIVKSVLVIDEAQDMDQDEYELISELAKLNDEMRVIMVGDDDQNIFQFRGSDSKYMKLFLETKAAKAYELFENYRSTQRIVAYANRLAGKIQNRLKKQEIMSYSEDVGEVLVFSHNTPNMEIPLVNEIMETYHGGNVGVLTRTNEEALQIFTLLQNNGCKAKLIQSNDGFWFYNLIEIRFFMQTLSQLRKDSNPIISVEIWEEAKSKVVARYADSICFEIVENMIKEYETTSPIMYYTDFEQFIKESHIEDFYDTRINQIYVSTIHKAKGREFDTVYLMLKNETLIKEEDIRKVYVGLTRAKSSLHVHYNNHSMDFIDSDGMLLFEETKRYESYNRIVSQLSHRDVFLDFFKGKTERLIHLKSGMKLDFLKNGLSVMMDGHAEMVVQFSKGYMERMKEFLNKGYRPVRANIRYVVAWEGKESEKTSIVILPDIEYERSVPFVIPCR